MTRKHNTQQSKLDTTYNLQSTDICIMKSKDYVELICSVVLFVFRCAGYLFQKVGKVAATAVGGGLLLLQVWYTSV